MTFTIRWPDGAVQECYSPSLVMWDHLQPGAQYTVAEFVDRATTGLQAAGERVRERWGYGCSAAIAQADDLQSRARAHPAGAVQVVAMAPPLPSAVA